MLFHNLLHHCNHRTLFTCKFHNETSRHPTRTHVRLCVVQTSKGFIAYTMKGKMIVCYKNLP